MKRPAIENELVEKVLSWFKKVQESPPSSEDIHYTLTLTCYAEQYEQFETPTYIVHCTETFPTKIYGESRSEKLRLLLK